MAHRGKSAKGVVTAPESPASTYYVYLLDGGVVEVGPADGIRVSGDALEVMLGDTLVASFDRRRVFTCSRDVRVSPQLG